MHQNLDKQYSNKMDQADDDDDDDDDDEFVGSVGSSSSSSSNSSGPAKSHVASAGHEGRPKRGDDDDDNDDENDEALNNASASRERPRNIVGTRYQYKSVSTQSIRRTALELQDCKDALEHIVMVGNHYRHRAWRINSWKHRVQLDSQQQQQHQHQQQQQHEKHNDQDDDGEYEGPQLTASSNVEEDTAMKKNTRNNGRRKRKRSQAEDEEDVNSDDGSYEEHSNEQEEKIEWDAIHSLHAEDVRIFGLPEGFPAVPWPLESKRGVHHRNKVSSDIDAPWDEEYGDNIPLLDFTADRLSRVIPQKTVQDSVDAMPFATVSKETELLLDPNRIRQMDPDRLSCTIAKEDVPSAILLRCWQRAVDIASFTTLQPTCAVDQSTTRLGGASEMVLSDTQDSTRLQQLQKSAQDRCADMTIDMYPWGTPRDPPFKCRLCTCEFPTLGQLKEHFHGSDNVRGCSWSEIHSRQREMVADALAKEVDAQANTLVRLIMTKAKERLAARESRPNKKRKAESQTGRLKDQQPERPELFSWKDVLEMLQEVLASSQDREGAKDDEQSGGDEVPEIKKTLQVVEGMAPLVLNRHVLDASTMWLIDRYAHVPK
jgi:hypothetical protein